MKAIAIALIISGLLLMGGVALFVGNPIHKLIEAGSGRMAIVPPSEPIKADCGNALSVGDAGCNVHVQEYDTTTMLLTTAGIGILLLAASSFVVFALACLIPGGYTP